MIFVFHIGVSLFVSELSRHQKETIGKPSSLFLQELKRISGSYCLVLERLMLEKAEAVPKFQG